VAPSSGAPARTCEPSFPKTIEPFLAKNCVLCHNARLKTADRNLDAYHDANTVIEDRDVWENVLDKLRSEQMPPKGAKQPRLSLHGPTAA
jgi:hypothetical protein